jgi:tRNA dimethylallyltransferase
MDDMSFTAEPKTKSGFPKSSGPCVVVAGPTASGKSALAITLAQAIGGEIVNADSMQVYHDLSILTARPSEKEMGDIPHHLYGILASDVTCDAGLWLSWLHRLLPEIWSRGKVPVLVGGTGLYLRSLAQGLAPVPDVPESVREQASYDYKMMGPEVFSALLAEKDPISAAAIPATNRQRMIRAMEVFDHTGKPLTWWQKQPHHGGLPSKPITVVLEPERAWLYARSDARFLQMLKHGAWDQVRAAMAAGIGPEAPVSRGLGTRAMMATLNGDIPKDEAIALAQKETRNYAKRQLTWFRNQMTADIRLHPPEDSLDSESVATEVVGKLRDLLENTQS